MRALLLIGLLFFTSCGAKTAYVFEDEYVLWADGWWCEYAPEPLVLASSGGGCGGAPARPPGLYLVDEKGQIKSRSTSRRVEFDEKRTNVATRECTRFNLQGVECAPNFFIKSASISNEPLFSELWGLTKDGLDAEILWSEIGESSPNIKVAVTDTGIMCEHEDFEPGCIEQLDAISGHWEQEDDSGHGSHVAGTICADGDNERGISGVSKECQLYAAKFLDSRGGGSLHAAVKAIQFGINAGVHIINASWGSPFGDRVLKGAVSRANDAGILFIVAAGNDNQNIDEDPQFPAAYHLPNVITVGAHNEDGERAYFSNYGPKTVEVFAPGTSILSTSNDGGYKRLQGTSMAAPHVSGLAALLWEQELGKGTKKAQMLRVRDRLLAMGDRTLSEYSRYGVLRASEENQIEQSQCRVKRCERCMLMCEDRFNCRCDKWQKCRKRCRKQNNCKGGCK